MFKKKIRQYGDKFRVQDFTNNDNLNTSTFDEVRNKNGAKVLEGKVIILYEDEYDAIIQENVTLKHKLEDLQSTIDEGNSKIKQLEGEIDAKEQSYNDKANDLTQKISQLEDDINTIDKEHLQEITSLKEKNLKDINQIEKTHSNEIIELGNEHHHEITSLNEELSTIKEEHLKEINKKDKAHSDEVVKIRDSYIALTLKNNRSDERYIEELEDLSFIDKIRGKDKAIYKEMKEKNRLKIDDDYIKGHIASPEDD